MMTLECECIICQSKKGPKPRFCPDSCGKLKSLSHLAISCFVNYHNCILHIEQLANVAEGFTAAMKAHLLNYLWAHALYMQVFELVTSRSFFESLFSSEWYKMLELHAMNTELDEMGRGLTFQTLNQLCLSELQDGLVNRKFSKFMSYLPIPLNYSFFLIDGGYYIEALEIIDQLITNTECFMAEKEDRKTCLTDVYVVILTAKFKCHNTLYDLKEGGEIYLLKLDFIKRTCLEKGPEFGNLAAAYFVECSRYCFIKGDVHASHEHAMQALQLVDRSIDHTHHPRIIIDVLRQATLTFLELGLPGRAEISIETALTLCKNIVDKADAKRCLKCYDLSDSLLFLDCMVDYGYFLQNTDQLYKAHQVIREAKKVSSFFEIMSCLSCTYIVFYSRV